MYGIETINRINEEAAKRDTKRQSELRSKARLAIGSLLGKCRALKEFRDVEYLEDRDKQTDRFRWSRMASGATDGIQETFEFCGFEGAQELYSLPKESRKEFFDRGIEFVEAIFGKDADGLERLLTSVDKEEDQVQLKLLQLRAEDITTETRMALTAIAASIKERAQELFTSV